MSGSMYEARMALAAVLGSLFGRGAVCCLLQGRKMEGVIGGHEKGVQYLYWDDT